MLASRGYAVLQPQFRGSGGSASASSARATHGVETMQDDVSAGAEWLVPGRSPTRAASASTARSYGGYAACGRSSRRRNCSGAAPASLVSAISACFSRQLRPNQRARPLSVLRMVGRSRKTTRRLDQVSPLLGVGRIQAPVLLAHGDKDERVPIVHSEQMLQALKAAANRSSGSSSSGEGHGIADDEPGALLRRLVRVPPSQHPARHRRHAGGRCDWRGVGAVALALDASVELAGANDVGPDVGIAGAAAVRSANPDLLAFTGRECEVGAAPERALCAVDRARRT